MNRPLHLARKDARRLGGALGFWLALFPLPAALLVAHAAGRLNSFGPGAPDMLVNVHRVLGVAGFLLSIQLALEDPLHDPDAGWRTRPIHLRDLLLAKLGLACAALVAAPTALLALVWAGAGFSPRDIAMLALDQATTLALLAGFGLLLGALTRNLGQALLWLTGTLAALLPIILSTGKHSWIITRFLLTPAFAALVLALCLIYRRRSSNIPRLLIGGLGFAAATLAALAFLFPKPAPRFETTPRGPASPLSVGAEIRLGSEHLRLVRMEPDANHSTPARPVLRVEWRRLAPHRSLFSRETDVKLPPPVITGPDGLALATLSDSSRVSQLAGLRFTSHELLLPATAGDGAIWHPVTTSTSASAPTP